MSEPIKNHKGVVVKGKFKPDDSTSFKLDFCRHEGKRVAVTVKRETKRRSIKENNYYWGVVIALMSDVAGYTPEQMHEALKWEHLRQHTDSKLPTVRSTTELTTVEMEAYLEACRRTGAECYGVYVPEPNEI